MDSKILVSFSLIGLILILTISGTMSFFLDKEIGSENTFSAGTLDLLIADNDENFGNNVTATWTADNMNPGDERLFMVEKVELAKEINSIDADHLEIACDYSVIEENPCLESDTDCYTNEHPEEMAKEMLITRCVYHDMVCIDCLTGIKYDGHNYTEGVCAGSNLGQSDDWKIEDQDGDGKISFYELKNDKLDNLPAVQNSPPFSFRMSVKFNESADNNFQGDQFVLDMIFTLNQDASQ